MSDTVHTFNSKVARLETREDGLYLVSDTLSYRGDYLSLLPRLQCNSLHRELLVRAAKIPPEGTHPLAVDATAGMGEDSLLLAAAGYRVLLLEKDPVIAALLRDTICRAAQDPRLSEFVSRMTLQEGDSLNILPTLSEQPDFVYLDPMFPERRKSGLIKKKFQLIHQLEKPCEDENALLEAALRANPGRILVKRPLKAPFLGLKKPSHSLKGSVIRYDCLVLNVHSKNSSPG